MSRHRTEAANTSATPRNSAVQPDEREHERDQRRTKAQRTLEVGAP
jgi:hypothetical protein